MLLLSPDQHTDYQLIDSGGFEKLERFGQYILSRPEPQAIWDKSLSDQEWANRAHATFKRDKNSQEKGQWISKEGMPDKWTFQYRAGALHLRAKLALSSFK
ncbi:MAG TPA: oxidoreductase, partial [Dyadobacter sp.]|nr:oxidoreductase [Dyadobacter sp.]